MSFVRFVVAALVLCAALATPLKAATFTDLASFEAALNAGSYTETFDGFDPFSFLGVSSDFSGGAYAYTASTPTQGLLVYFQGTDGYLTTATSVDGFSGPITFTFTSGNVNAVGGRFFLESLFGDIITPDFSFPNFTLTFSDGTVENLVSSGLDGFFGYIGDATLTSMTITPAASHRFVGVADFIVGSAPTTVPEPASAVAMLGGAGLLALRRRSGR